MKKLYLLVLIVFLNSCSQDSVEPSMKELVLENIKANAFILDEAFAKTVEIVQTQGNLEMVASTMNTRDEFITYMNGLVDDVILDVIETHGSGGTQFATTAMQWDSKAPHHTSVQNNIKQLGLFSPPIGLYSSELDLRIALLQGDLTLIQNHRTSNSQVVPVEQFSLNFGKIELDSRKLHGFVVEGSVQSAVIKQGLGNLTLSSTSLEDMDEGINNFVSNHRDTEVFISLLLPAIQKIRDNPQGSKSSYQKFTDLIFGTQSTPERKLFDQQVRYIALLAALDFITSKDFKSYDENFASIPVQDAMYHATVVLGWARLHDTYQ